jgi:hypothetical protein
VDRKNAGEALVEAVAAAAFDASDHFGWVACDNRTTRAVAKRARWLVRVMTSLMLFPGHDEDDERSMLEEFVVPIVLPSESRQATQ